MSKRIPVARQISSRMFLLEAAEFTAVIFGFWLLLSPALGSFALVVGAGVCLIWLYSVRLVLAKFQRRGMKLIQQRDFRPAIAKFEQSYAFFSQHEWLDRYRAVILLSQSAMSYRESALVNIAYCYAQLGDGQQAKAYYERALAEYPDSGIAQGALNLINAVSKG